MPQFFAVSASLLASGLAAAQTGHGFSGPHWHAGELIVPAMMLACATATFWLWRKK